MDLSKRRFSNPTYKIKVDGPRVQMPFKLVSRMA